MKGRLPPSIHMSGWWTIIAVFHWCGASICLFSMRVSHIVASLSFKTAICLMGVMSQAPCGWCWWSYSFYNVTITNKEWYANIETEYEKIMESKPTRSSNFNMRSKPFIMLHGRWLNKSWWNWCNKWLYLPWRNPFWPWDWCWFIPLNLRTEEKMCTVFSLQ